MTTGYAESGPEVLTFGSPRPGRPPVTLTWSRIVLVLVLGTLVGAWSGHEVAARTYPPVQVVAGALHEVASCSASCLELDVLNTGRTDLTLVPVALGPRTLPPGSEVAVARPGRWTTVRLHAPVSCAGSRPERVTTVTLAATTAEVAPRRVSVQVERGAGVPGSRHDRLCPRGHAVSGAALRGWWTGEGTEVQRPDTTTPRIHFGDEGRFELWLVDRVRGPHVAVSGLYGVTGRLLVTVVMVPEGPASTTSIWRITGLDGQRLNLARMKGLSRPWGPVAWDTWTVHRIAGPAES